MDSPQHLPTRAATWPFRTERQSWMTVSSSRALILQQSLGSAPVKWANQTPLSRVIIPVPCLIPIYFKKVFTYLFYFWLRSAFIAAHGPPLQAVTGFSLQWLAVEHGLHGDGLQQLCTWTQSFWHSGFLALWHVESSRTRDQADVTWIARQILNPWTTQGGPYLLFDMNREYDSRWLSSNMISVF